jgi:hypothetical protein
MKNSTKKGLTDLIIRIQAVEDKINRCFHIDEDNLTIKDAREYGYINTAINEMVTIVEDMKAVRRDFFSKDGE